MSILKSILSGGTAICIVLTIVSVSFIAGWLFPVEGPFDYVYDDYVTIHKAKHSKGVASPQSSKEIFIFNGEILEQYQLMTEEQEDLATVDD